MRESLVKAISGVASQLDSSERVYWWKTEFTISSGKRLAELRRVLRKPLRYLDLGGLERFLQPLFHDCAFILDAPWRMVPKRLDILDGSVKD